MAKCDLTIELDHPGRTIAGGQLITGHVVARVDKKCRCDGLHVMPRLLAHGRGNRYRDSFAGQTVFAGEWQPGEYRYPFRLTAPNGPQSYSGSSTNIEWTVSAEADIPWAFDPKASSVFRLIAGHPDTYSTGTIAVNPAASSQWSSFFKLGCLAAVVLPLTALSVAVLYEYSQTREPVTLIAGAVWLLLAAGITVFGARNYIAGDKLGEVLFQAPEVVRAGDDVELTVSFTAKPGTVVQSIHTSLVATERVVSGSGTDRKVYRRKVVDESLTETVGRALGPLQPQQHTFVFNTSRRAPTTFALPSNALSWTVAVHVEVEGWPDYRYSQGLLVLPAVDENEYRPATASELPA